MTMPEFDDPDVQIAAVQVNPGDPHNDQLAAHARDDLHWHVESTRKLLAQGPDDASAMAVISITLSENEEIYPIGRVAAMLSAALVQMAHEEAKEAVPDGE